MSILKEDINGIQVSHVRKEDGSPSSRRVLEPNPYVMVNYFCQDEHVEFPCACIVIKGHKCVSEPGWKLCEKVY